MIIILLLTIIFLIIIHYSSKTTESFQDNVKFQLVNGNQFQDNRFQIYNQNYESEWKEPPGAYNDPIVQNYGDSFNDMYKMNQYIFNDFQKEDLDKFTKEYGEKLDVNRKQDFDLDYTPFDVYNLNKAIWFDNYKWDPAYVLFQRFNKSKILELNTMNEKFLYMINKYWFKFIEDYVKRKVAIAKPYFILKYRIVNIWTSKDKKYRLCDSVVVITRDNAFLAFYFFLSGLFEYNPEKKVYEYRKMDIKYIANNTLDKVLLHEGLDKNNTYFNINPLWDNDTSYNEGEAEKLYEKEENKMIAMDDILDNSYACFTFDETSKNPGSTPIFATDKNDCENKFDMIGYKKPSGVWDKPCKDDSECMFFQSNKNYKNTYGRCINSKCEVPSNMKPLGYHYYVNSNKTEPLCYNCESKEWLPNTKPDFCCDEQKNNREKYPFLNSPDYAFNGDALSRYNAYIQKKCTMSPSYDNIFKKTNVWKIDCKGFLDSYSIQK